LLTPWEIWHSADCEFVIADRSGISSLSDVSSSEVWVMRRFQIPSLIASTWVLASSTALAGEVHQYPECQKQVTEIDVLGAKGAFQAGNVSFNEADYERAILYWEDAFRRDCTATLLLHHLSRAYEGQGNLEQAVVALKTYLDRTPDAAERTQSLRRIEVFEQKIEEERQRAARAAEEEKAKRTPPPKPAPAPPPAPRKSNLYVSPKIPITVGAVGVVATVVGAIMYFPARNDVKHYNSLCTSKPTRPGTDGCPSDILDDAQSAESRRNWGAAVGITGLVLAVGGVGWAIFNDTQKPTVPAAPKAPALLPWVGPQWAGLSYGGAF
jgi:hypothetical protein